MIKSLTWLALIILIVVGGFLLFSGDSSAPTEDLESSEQIHEDQEGSSEDNSANNEQSGDHIVIYTDSGYSPSSLNIKMGEKVIFKNESSQGMWTATAVHPTHTVYPGTDIKNCKSVAEGEMFDSCGNTSVGEEWPFVFNEKGSWGYHNHIRSSHTGRIIVE